jgi:hypothetical protein
LLAGLRGQDVAVIDVVRVGVTWVPLGSVAPTLPLLSTGPFD